MEIPLYLFIVLVTSISAVVVDFTSTNIVHVLDIMFL